MTVIDLDSTRKNPDLKQAVVQNLLRARDAAGHIPTERVRRAAGVLQVDKRTVWRYVAQAKRVEAGEPPKPTRVAWEPDEEFQKKYVALGGNAKLTMDAMETLGRPVGVSVRTVQRWFERRFDSALRKAASTGEVSAVVPILDRTHIQFRNQSWTTDHTQLRNYVRIGATVCKPWMTTIEDEGSRMVLAIVLSPHSPTTETTIEALVRAAVGFEIDGEFVGGKPEAVHSDQGGDLTNEAMTRLEDVGIIRTTSQAYSSWQNGRIERWHGEIKRERLRLYPGYYNVNELTAEERRAHTRSIGKGVCPLPALELPTFEEFTAMLWMDAMEHNQKRPHSALGGRTPFEVWKSDPTEIEKVDEVELRAAATNREKRIVTKGRVRLFNEHYMSSDLDARGRGVLSTYEGRKVELRFIPGLPETVWVFDPVSGRRLCDAILVQDRTQEDVAATMKSRTELIKLFTNSREDAVEIRRQLGEQRLEAFEELAAEYLPIVSSKAPTTKKKEGRKKSANHEATVTELEAETLPDFMVRTTRTDGADAVQDGHEGRGSEPNDHSSVQGRVGA